MKKKISLKFQSKIFLVILLMLAFNMIVMLGIGTTFLEDIYVSNKVESLKTSANLIKSAINNDELLYNTIIDIEQQNIQAYLFTINENLIYVNYYTMNYPRGRFGPDAAMFLRQLYDTEVFQSIKEEKDIFVISGTGESIQSDQQSISAVVGIGENQFLLLQTPRQYIRETAVTAIEYTFYISLVSYAVVCLLTYILSVRISKPIAQIQSVADKISNLDFSTRCEVKSNDETGLLAQSINNMSDRLQDNIDQLVLANEVLKNDLAREEKTGSIRRQFIANVSHDFKTPLTLIMSYGEALRDLGLNLSGEEKKEYLDIIIKESNRMSGLVAQLLGLSQLESGIVKIYEAPFSIAELVRSTMSKYRIVTAEKQLETVVEVDDNLIVSADYEKIVQVFDNIVDNAVKYTQSGGRIEAYAEVIGGLCRISVKNSAQPIPENELENLFISFYRADKVRGTQDKKSYGLGLSIVKAIMDMHGCAYGAYNEADGVVFWFELPLIELKDETGDDMA